MASDEPNVVVLGNDPGPLHEIIVIKGRDDAHAHAGIAANDMPHNVMNIVLRYGTDASRRGMAEEDPVGAAICFRSLLTGSGWRDYGMKCHNLTTSAAGELQAVAMAIKHAVGTLPKLEESVQKQVQINIFSDSTYALQKISGSREPESYDEVTICRDILEYLRFLPIEPGRVKMFWVPAHAGNHGNERVDKKADIASKQAQDMKGFPLAQHGLAPLVWSRAQVHDPLEYPHQNGEAKPGQTQTLTTVYPRMTATYELNMPFKQQSNELEDTFKILIKIHNGCRR